MNEGNFHNYEWISDDIKYSYEEFKVAKDSTIKDMTDFITWNEYRERLIIEYKNAKIEPWGFALDNFQEKIKNITLDESELNDIDTEINKRKDIIANSADKIHLYELAFEDDKSTLVEAEWFYVPSTNQTIRYYKSKDGPATLCQNKHIYIKNMLKSDSDIEIKTIIFHELTHALVDGNNVSTWAQRLLSKHWSEYYYWLERYTGNITEQFARLWEMRHYLKLYWIINNMNEIITLDHLQQFMDISITDKNTQSMLIHLKQVIAIIYKRTNNFANYINLINSVASKDSKKENYNIW